MTAGDWTGLVLQVVATGAAAVAAVAAWRSVVAVSNERKADARWRADEHLKTIHALIIRWSQAFFYDRRSAFEVQMALRRELQVMTALEGPLPKCLALANTEHSTIMPDEVPGLADATTTEVEAARYRMFGDHTVDIPS
jgi:hypothetical protein